MISVIVVDDHVLFRNNLKIAFKYECTDISIVGEAETGEELFSVLASTAADLVLLDINLPDIWGVEVARRLRREYPDVKILAVSAENTTETVKAMLEAGIEGFVSKQRCETDELANAIRTVMSGSEYFGGDIANIMFRVYVSKKKTAEVTHEFTDREREIILLCRDGLMMKEIAAKLNVSPNTVKTHKMRIFQKLGINNQMEMVNYALQKKIIKIEN